MSDSVYIFAGGGTGGHLYPGLAVAPRLQRLDKGAKIVFACSDREIDAKILSQTPYGIVPQAILPMPRSLHGWGAFIGSLVRSRTLARRLVDDLRPAAVFGLGGFAAVPVVRAAAGRGVPCCLLSIDAVPGLANKTLARYTQAVFTQYEQTAAHYGRQADRVRLVGYPVSQERLGGTRGEALAAFGLRPDRQTLLVMGGSLGGGNVNQAICALRGDLEPLADRWQILHITGNGKLEEVRCAWQGSALNVAVAEYCHNIGQAYAAADLVLCRSGAATLGELVALAKPAVLMPYPYHRDQQQLHNAKGMVEQGSAVLAPDAMNVPANVQTLRQILCPILHQPQLLDEMCQKAATNARADAAERIAQWLVEAR
jgi:UDP-N-acetylglucosamine--N-acetylmuramyl-(pentapeptide) pyrophosphoryl-undecaprenol N-acetylglucosamine transferase